MFCHLWGLVVGFGAVRGATWQRLPSSGTELPPVSLRDATCCTLTAALTQLAGQTAAGAERPPLTPARLTAYVPLKISSPASVGPRHFCLDKRWKWKFCPDFSWRWAQLHRRSDTLNAWRHLKARCFCRALHNWWGMTSIERMIF